MKAITLHAPWGTLLAIGAKKWETRSWPCPPSIIGQRIAFHQAKRKPIEGEGIGRYLTTRRPDLMLPDGTPLPGHWLLCDWDAPDDVAPIQLPLGCIVASGVITRSLPIRDGMYPGPMPPGGDIVVAPSGLFDRTKNSSQFGYDLTDQEPYGAWSVGRWAWELSDVAAVTERCPVCWGSGSAAPEDEEWDQRYTWGNCETCDGAGALDPIPAKGKQGFWNWQGEIPTQP